MGWTEERVELLEKLWAEGLSASQIAGRLGDVTRNAVIGKVHRLGLAARATPHAEPRKRRRVRPVAVTPAPVHRPRCTPAPRLVFASQDIELCSLGIGMQELKPHMCRWPFGDPKRDPDGFNFCGREASGSYCDGHARIAYRPAERRRRP